MDSKAGSIRIIVYIRKLFFLTLLQALYSFTYHENLVLKPLVVISKKSLYLPGKGSMLCSQSAKGFAFSIPFTLSFALGSQIYYSQFRCIPYSIEKGAELLKATYVKRDEPGVQQDPTIVTPLSLNVFTVLSLNIVFYKNKSTQCHSRNHIRFKIIMYLCI